MDATASARLSDQDATHPDGQYGTVAKWFHWITVGLIAIALPTGFVIKFITEEADGAYKMGFYAIHESAGLTVLFAAVQASSEERGYEIAILRVLGAGRSMIFGSVLSEFSLMGALSGLMAATGASLGGAWLAHALELNYRFDSRLWLIGVAASVLILGCAGAISTRAMVRAPPRSVLY